MLEDDLPPLPEVPPPPGTRSVIDIPFGPHPRQRLDLHVLASGSEGVIAFVHGGSWARRDRKVVRCWYLLECGYAVASLGYRLSQHAPFPAQVRDVNAGLAKLSRIAPEHGLRMDRLGLLGLSAGGHLAALAALARDVPDFAPDPGIRIRAVVDYYGPSDLARSGARSESALNEAVSQLLGAGAADAQAVSRASPVNHCQAGSPPFLLIHGDADTVVPVRQSLDLHARLHSVGADPELIVVPGGGHVRPRMHTPEIEARICRFLDHRLKT